MAARGAAATAAGLQRCIANKVGSDTLFRFVLNEPRLPAEANLNKEADPTFF
jgi:hypothetical protein